MFATVSFQSYFCLLYRASPSLAAKNIINLILVLAIWWYPCVKSSLVLLEGVCAAQCLLVNCYDQLAKLYYPLPCFILFSKAEFACYSRYLLTSYFCIPVPYDLWIFGVSFGWSCRSSSIHSTLSSSALLVGAKPWITVILNGLPWKWTEIILSFLRLHEELHFRHFSWLWGLLCFFCGILAHRSR